MVYLVTIVRTTIPRYITTPNIVLKCLIFVELTLLIGYFSASTG